MCVRACVRTSHLSLMVHDIIVAGAETHFKVVVVSESFQGMPLIKVSVSSLIYLPTPTKFFYLCRITLFCIVLQRHRVVMDTLKAEMEGPVHALSIQV